MASFSGLREIEEPPLRATSVRWRGDQSPYAGPDLMLAAYLRARDGGAVPEETELPTLALIPIVREAGMRNNPGDMSAGTRAMVVDLCRENLDATDV